MKGGTLFSRVIPADKDRGYVLLLSWEKPVVQRTCVQMSTMGDPTRASLNNLLDLAERRHGPSTIVDVTEAGIAKKLAKMFGEVVEKVKVPKVKQGDNDE